MRRHNRPLEGPARTWLSLVKSAVLGAASYALAALLHEGVGHGLGCILADGTIELVTSSYLTCSRQGARIDLAGPAANALAFVVFAAWTKSLRGGRLHHFAWLETAWNLYWFTGYLLYAGVTGHGDWAFVVREVRMGRALLAVAGFFAVVQSIRWCRRHSAFGQASAIVAAYAGASTAALWAAALDPTGFMGLLAQAPPAAPLAGVCLLLSAAHPNGTARDLNIALPHLTVLVLSTLAFITLLGPGWRL
jgi:hypothetical protein